MDTPPAHHSISDRENAAGSTAVESHRCVWCDAVGRSVAVSASDERVSTMALVGFQGRGCAEIVHPDLCHALFRKAFLLQWP
jgi:hypothetical protein